MESAFQSAYHKVYSLYLNNPMVDPEEVLIHLARLKIMLENMGEKTGSGELRLACNSAINPKHIADYLLPLHLLEFSMEILKWPLGRTILEELFVNQTDPGIRLKIEIIIRRVYDPNWQLGECRFIELEESVWSYLRRKNNDYDGEI